METSNTTKRPLEDDIVPEISSSEPQAKRERHTEYYQYIILGATPEFTYVYLLDMASPGAADAHALIQRRMQLDDEKNTIQASQMIDMLCNDNREDYSDKWKLAAELKALKETGHWECLDPNAEVAQGHHGIVYYVFGFE